MEECMKFFKWQIITITTILSLYALYNIHLIERISIRQYFDLMFSVEKSISHNILRPKSEQTVAFANDKKAYGFEGHEDENEYSKSIASYKKCYITKL